MERLNTLAEAARQCEAESQRQGDGLADDSGGSTTGNRDTIENMLGNMDHAALQALLTAAQAQQQQR